MKSIIDKLTKNGISNIKGIAIITDTSSEIIFYGNINGERMQSNQMSEENYVSFELIDTFYDNFTNKIRTLSNFKNDKTNIITFNDEGIETYKYEKLDCHNYLIKKEWEKTSK